MLTRYNARPMGKIFRFWVPMAGTWLMMSIEGPFLAAVIARLDDPKHNLAAFGVAFAVAILVEAPVIMIMSASTTLVRGPASFHRLRNFTQILNAAITVVMLVLLVTPLWRTVASAGMGLPPRVVELTQVALWILLPWPGAIGYRRFYQGLLIRHGLTRRVAYGTAVRLATMATTALTLYIGTDLPGAWVGASALTLGVCVEAVVSRIMVQGVVRDVTGTPMVAAAGVEATGRDAAGEAPGSAIARAAGAPVAPDGDDDLSYGRIVSFYTPLALTSMIGLGVHPVVTFLLGHARYPLESLAVMPVINSLSFIFRSVGLSYQEVAIALLGRDTGNDREVMRFARYLAIGASVAMAMIVFTPLAGVWFRQLSGLSAELTAFALPPARILVVLPALSVALSWQRAVLVNARRTAPITWSTALEVGGIVTALAACTLGLDMVGATAAAVAFLAGRVAGNLSLIPPVAAARARS